MPVLGANGEPDASATYDRAKSNLRDAIEYNDGVLAARDGTEEVLEPNPIQTSPLQRLAPRFAEREFVIAARTLGARNSRILFRELLPNVIIPMGALVLLGVAAAIVAEGGLAFLGLSIEKGETWGKLIRNGAGSRVLRDSPWVAFGPITVMFLTLASLNYIGDYLRDFFNVRETGLGR